MREGALSAFLQQQQFANHRHPGRLRHVIDLDHGGIVVNDVSSYRVDNMPYGGVKDSGLGREGIRFAMEDMTEIRNLVIRRT